MDREAEDAYKILYKFYDDVMIHYAEYEKLVKHLQTEIRDQLDRKYPNMKRAYELLAEQKRRDAEFDREVDFGRP